MAYDPTHEYEHNYYPSIRARKLANAAHANRVNWLASDDRAQEIIDFLADYSPEGEGFFPALRRASTHTASRHPTCVTPWSRRWTSVSKGLWAERGKCEFVGTKASAKTSHSQSSISSSWKACMAFHTSTSAVT